MIDRHKPVDNASAMKLSILTVKSCPNDEKQFEFGWEIVKRDEIIPKDSNHIDDFLFVDVEKDPNKAEDVDEEKHITPEKFEDNELVIINPTDEMIKEAQIALTKHADAIERKKKKDFTYKYKKVIVGYIVIGGIQGSVLASKTAAFLLGGLGEAVDYTEKTVGKLIKFAGIEGKNTHLEQAGEYLKNRDELRKSFLASDGIKWLARLTTNLAEALKKERDKLIINNYKDKNIFVLQKNFSYSLAELEYQEPELVEEKNVDIDDLNRDEQHIENNGYLYLHDLRNNPFYATIQAGRELEEELLKRTIRTYLPPANTKDHVNIELITNTSTALTQQLTILKENNPETDKFSIAFNEATKLIKTLTDIAESEEKIRTQSKAEGREVRNSFANTGAKIGAFAAFAATAMIALIISNPFTLTFAAVAGATILLGAVAGYAAGRKIGKKSAQNAENEYFEKKWTKTSKPQITKFYSEANKNMDKLKDREMKEDKDDFTPK